MILLIFTSPCPLHLTQRQVESLQRQIWKLCQGRGLRGCLVQDELRFFGRLTGDAGTVIGAVETMLRAGLLSSATVLMETEIEDPGQGWWDGTLYTMADLRARVPELANLRADHVEPVQMNS